MIKTLAMRPGSEPEVLIPSTEAPGIRNHTQEVALMTDEKTAIRRDAAKVPTFTRLRDLGRTVSSSDQDIRGLMVKDKGGYDVGKIESLLIDDVGEKVRFLEVASGGFLGLGVRTSFIPVEAITGITADGVFISHTREHVLGAPRYHPGVVATDPDYFFSLYPYYGYEGYLGFFPYSAGYPWAKDQSTFPGDLRHPGDLPLDQPVRSDEPSEGE